VKKQDKIAVERYSKQLELVASSHAVNPFETLKERKEAIERAKKDFAFMVQRYFPHYATSATPKFHIDFANKVDKDKTFKGFAQWGRALSKSVVNNILLPFWLWIKGEPVYLVLVGNSGDRAEQLLEDIRAEFEANPQIISDFGPQHNPGNWEEGFFTTKGGFIGQALGMGQSVRGLRVKSKRPTHIVCDDLETKDLNANPSRQDKMAKWIERDLIPTMDGNTRRFIQANNRFAPKMIQTILQERHPDWVVDQVNAYDPVTFKPTWDSKYSDAYFRDVEKEIGTLAAQSEYNNSPHVEGSIFLEKDIQYAPLPRLNTFKVIYGFWDVAYSGSATSDYNAIVVQGLKDSNFWVIDVFCKQSKMSAAVAYMLAYQKALPPTVLVHWVFEAQFWNDAVKAAIAEGENLFNCRLNIIKRERSKVNKYDRMLQLQPYYQNGRIFYNEKLKHSNDAQVGLTQLYGIEPGYKSKDDYPDAHQGGVAELEKYVTYGGSGDGRYVSGKYNPSKNVI
jgi:phage terminase large subunit-like protein